MPIHNAENERLKRDYFQYLKEARRYSEASLDGVAKALHRFESYTRFKGFKAFHIQQAIGFKTHLQEQVGQRTNARLSKATLHSTLSALRAFFIWLAGRPGFKARLTYADADYFNLSEKDARVAKASRGQKAPTLEQILHVVRNMPNETSIQKRDRALVAFAIVTGARDGAIASFCLKHVNMAERVVLQDAREVRTKFSKTFNTWFFPVGEEIVAIVADWIDYLVREELWGPDDPLFPSTKVAHDGEQKFQATGLDRKPWSNATPIRKIFNQAFEAAGLPYANPHSFRNTLAALGQRVCRTPEELKAWSQNLGHEQVLTTLTSYGEVAPDRQADIIRALSRPEGEDEEVLRIARQIRAMRGG